MNDGRAKGQTADVSDAVYDYVSASLNSLTAQARVLGDPEYLKRFPPAQLAKVHAVMADMAARLIEAMQEEAAYREDMSGRNAASHQWL